MLNGGPICWKSRKQTIVAKSIAEAEYVTASACASEVIWFRHIYGEIGQDLRDTPTTIYVDNQSAIHISENEVHQSRAKSIAIPVHHIKDHIRLRNIELVKIRGDCNPADILTKPLETVAHRKCVSLLGMA